MAIGNGRVRGAIIATAATAVLGAGMMIFASQSSAETNGQAAGRVPVRAQLTVAPSVGKPIAFTVTGLGGGAARVEWSAAEPDADATFTSYSVAFFGPAIPKGLPTTTTTTTSTPTSPPPTGVPPTPVVYRTLPATARSVEITAGLMTTYTYTVQVLASGPQGQTANSTRILQATKLSVTAAPATAVYGAPVTLSGQVVGGEGPRSGELVTLEKRATGTSTWTRVGALRTSSSGTWSVVTKPAGITAFRTTFAGSTGLWPAVSPAATVTVRYLVSIKASTTKPKVNQKVTVSGAVRPVKAGVKVSLQRKSGATWVTIAGGTTKADGSYAIVKAFAQGTWPLRVVATGGTSLAYGTSGQVTVTAK